MSLGGDTRSGLDGICDIFADFFRSVYSSSSSACASSCYSNICEYIPVSSLSLSCRQVLNALLMLNTKKGLRSGHTPPLVLKLCAFELCYPLFSIFNLSLRHGVFPDRWKVSFITPIFKSGSRSDVANYRGVAILETIGKLLESIICGILTDHYRNYISRSQHGFISGRSVVTNLVEFTQSALETIEKGSQMDVIYTDFSKAFDRVNHIVLLSKLERIGVGGSLLRWIQSYLSNRQQRVKIQGVESKAFSVLSGVPQGSHLGPLLFLLFVNDIPSIFKTASCLMFADDLKIFSTVSNVRDSVQLQRDLDSLLSWCQANGLHLNVSKCKVVTFHRSSAPINFEYRICDNSLLRVEEMKDLGVIFDVKLTFNAHLDAVISKAYSMLGFMIRLCTDFDDPYTLKTLYCSIVRSILEYSSVVWNPGYAVHSDRIESIQRKFLLFALRRLPWRRDSFVLPAYESRCKLINLETLEERRKNTSIFFVYDLLNGRIDAPNLLAQLNINVPPRRLRNHDFLSLGRHRTNYALFGPISSASNLFNEVRDSFDFNLSRANFRETIRSGNP